MDNKKWYKRISVIFWFILATMPIWLSFCGYLLSNFMHTDSLTSAADIVSTRVQYDFDVLLRKYSSFILNFTPSFITEMFSSLFRSFNILAEYRDILKAIFGWFVWVYFIELMIDFIVWLPRWFHKLLDKVGD